MTTSEKTVMSFLKVRWKVIWGLVKMVLCGRFFSLERMKVQEKWANGGYPVLFTVVTALLLFAIVWVREKMIPDQKCTPEELFQSYIIFCLILPTVFIAAANGAFYGWLRLMLRIFKGDYSSSVCPDQIACTIVYLSSIMLPLIYGVALFFISGLLRFVDSLYRPGVFLLAMILGWGACIGKLIIVYQEVRYYCKGRELAGFMAMLGCLDVWVAMWILLYIGSMTVGYGCEWVL